MKSKLSLLLACLMILSLALPGVASATDTLPGGWNLLTDNAVPKDVQKVFYDALDDSYTPLVHCATQVVAGTNHMIVCSKDEEILRVVIYEDLGGEASEVEDMREVLASAGGDAGGWEVPTRPPVKLPAGAKAAHRKLYAKTFVPLLYCGSQVVAGTNYKILYRSRMKIFVATLYEDLEGNVKELASRRQMVIDTKK